MTKIRKGQAPAPLTRAKFHERFNVRFYDPAYGAERASSDCAAEGQSRRRPTRKAARPHHAPHGPWLRRPDISDFGTVAQDSQAPEGCAETLA